MMTHIEYNTLPVLKQGRPLHSLKYLAMNYHDSPTGWHKGSGSHTIQEGTEVCAAIETHLP